MNRLMKSFADELLKISAIQEILHAAKDTGAPLLKRHYKTLGLIGAGGLGVLGVQRGVKDIQMGEQIRKQMKEQG